MDGLFIDFVVISFVAIFAALVVIYKAILNVRNKLIKYTKDVNKKHCGVTNIVLAPQDSDDKTIQQITDGLKNIAYDRTTI